MTVLHVLDGKVVSISGPNYMVDITGLMLQWPRIPHMLITSLDFPQLISTTSRCTSINQDNRLHLVINLSTN